MNDLINYSYPSRHSVVYSLQGMIATSQHLAAQAGLDILKKEGNHIRLFPVDGYWTCRAYVIH